MTVMESKFHGIICMHIYTMCPNYLKSFIKFCSEFLSLYIKEKNKVLGTEVFLLKYNYV